MSLRLSDIGFRDAVSLSLERDFERGRPQGFLGSFREALEIRSLRHALVRAEARRDPVARMRALENSAAFEERLMERLRFGTQVAASLRAARERRIRRRRRRHAERRQRRQRILRGGRFRA